MKKDFSILNEEHIELLEDWLQVDDANRCDECPIRSCSICYELFPKIKKNRDCPCHIYTPKHLTGVARQAIKYLKEKYND